MKILGSGVTLIYRYRLISFSPVPFFIYRYRLISTSPVPFCIHRYRFILYSPVPLFIHRYRLILYSPVPLFIHRYSFTLSSPVPSIYSPVQFYSIFTGTTFLYSPVLFFIHRYPNFHSSGPGRILFTGPELIIGSILFTGPAFSGSGLTGYAGPIVFYTLVPTQSVYYWSHLLIKTRR